GRSTCRPMAARAASPPVRAATAARGRSPASITARRTAVAGTPAALATASAITPSSAPWRSSPSSRRRTNSASAAVARPRRSVRAATLAGRAPVDPTTADVVTSSLSSTPRSCQAPAVDFATMMALEPHGPDTYVGVGPRYPWGGLYGGQIVAQGLRAASLTVE